MKRIIAIYLLMLTLCSCYYRKEASMLPSATVCDTASVTFAASVYPIIKQNCDKSGCHAGVNPPGGYSYDSYEGVHQAASEGRLLGAINHEGGFSFMPKDAAKLGSCEINTIAAWVNRGALNN